MIVKYRCDNCEKFFHRIKKNVWRSGQEPYPVIDGGKIEKVHCYDCAHSIKDVKKS